MQPILWYIYTHPLPHQTKTTDYQEKCLAKIIYGLLKIMKPPFQVQKKLLARIVGTQYMKIAYS